MYIMLLKHWQLTEFIVMFTCMCIFSLLCKVQRYIVCIVILKN